MQTNILGREISQAENRINQTENSIETTNENIETIIGDGRTPAQYSQYIVSLENRIATLENVNINALQQQIANNIQTINGKANNATVTALTNRVAELERINAQMQEENNIERNVPVGTIVMWGGGNLPGNGKWALCNGQNGTPDLRNRFIVGAGGSYNTGATGGANQVTLTIDEMPEHKHLMWFNGNNANNPWGYINNSYSSTADRGTLSTDRTLNYNSPVGKSKAHENRPPYYALSYIMKIRE